MPSKNNTIVARNADQALEAASSQILAHGDEVGSRVGRTKEALHSRIVLEKPREREILNPKRKANIAAQIAETMWVLAGRNDVEWLERYLPRAPEFSDDGEIWRGGYGPRIREFGTGTIVEDYGATVDQLGHVVELLKKDPGTRRAVINIYDPLVDTQEGKDIPCNNWLSFISRDGYLDLSVAIRSNDLIWGWSGINQFEWSVLQEVVAWYTGMKVGQLSFTQTSLHIYEKHWLKAEEIVAAGLYTTHSQTGSVLFEPGSRDFGDFDGLVAAWFRVEEIIRNGPWTSAASGEIDAFPEPLLQSWLRIIQWWWSGNPDYLAVLDGSSLGMAAKVGMQPNRHVTSPSGTPKPSDFATFVTNLHNEKHAAYGDSWKRRGERVAIQANIARKVDRLGGGETRDETSADTAIDLLVYLAKYRTWLKDEEGTQVIAYATAGDLSDTPDAANEIINEIDLKAQWPVDFDRATAISAIKSEFEKVLEMDEGISGQKNGMLSAMTNTTYYLARSLWQDEQDEYKGADCD